MPPMPYVVTQGQVLTALENAFNHGHKSTAGEFRTALEVRVATLLDHKNSDKNNPTVGKAGRILSDQVDNHMETHWFGPQGRPPGPTGWWVNWNGPAREIARQGMIVALEMSLGLDRGEDVPVDHSGLAMHPMDFSWVCPVPRFEVWVGKRSWGGDPPPPLSPEMINQRPGEKCTPTSVICVTFATPGYSEGPGRPPLAAAHLRADVGSGNAPETTGIYHRNEHIVIGAAETRPTAGTVAITSTVNASPTSPWFISLGIGMTASDQIKTIRVDEQVDGVAADGATLLGTME